MSLKDNFNQALKELLKNEGLVGDGLKGSGSKKEADRFKDTVPESLAGESLAPSEGYAPDSDMQDGYNAPDPFGAPSAPEGYATGISDRMSDRTNSPEPSAEDFIQSVHNRNSPDPFADFDDTNTDASSEPVRPSRTERPERFEYTTSEQPSENARQRGYGSGNGYNASGGGEQRADSGQTFPRTGGSYGGRPYGESSYGGRPYGGGYAPSGNGFRGGRPPENPYYETEETTIISRNTRINGDVSSFANITVEGSVQGDIKLTKNINVSGKVVGNIECNNAVMAGAQMQGSIASKGQVQMDHDSVLLGNIATQYLDLNGRIKGSVDVGGKAEFKNDAVIVGDITASTISVIDGAVIKGYVNTTFMQESTSNVFPEAITVGEA